MLLATIVSPFIKIQQGVIFIIIYLFIYFH